MRALNHKHLLELVGSSAALFLWFVAYIRTARERATETINEERRLLGVLSGLMSTLQAEVTVLREDWAALYAKSGTLNSRAQGAKLTLIATLRKAILALQQKANLVPPTADRRAAAHSAQGIRTLTKLLADAEELAADVRRQQDELQKMRSWLGSSFR